VLRDDQSFLVRVDLLVHPGDSCGNDLYIVFVETGDEVLGSEMNDGGDGGVFRRGERFFLEEEFV